MAHAKNHDYHILPPSLWPFLGATAAFIMLVGAVAWMKGIEVSGIAITGPWMFLIGFVGVLYVMFGWWADVVNEGEEGDHTPVVRIGLQYGFILFIISEVMFFVAWFWAFFKNALYPMGPESPIKDGVWPPEGITTFDPWHLPLINTLILLLSGVAVTWAHHALVHENDRKTAINGLAVAVVDRDGLVHAAGFGVADVATGSAVTTETRFYIASATKSFTALSLAAMARRGEVNLDAPLADWAPPSGVPADIAARITLTDLLSHPEHAGFDGEITLGSSPVALPGESLCAQTTGAVGAFKGVTEPADLHWWLFDLVTPETVGMEYAGRYANLCERVSKSPFSRLRLVPYEVIFNADEAEAMARYQEEHPAAGSGWATVAGTSFSVVERRDDYCATAFAYCSQPQAVPCYDLAAAVADLGEFAYEKIRELTDDQREFLNRSLLNAPG